MTITEYIKDQLLFSDEVTLPGLGTFEIRKSPSRISGSKIIPPSQKIIFNSDKTLDGGNLTKAISTGEEISIEEADQRILEFIDEILFAINKGDAYTFPDFGKLYKDSENIYRFEKNPGFKIDFETFGLESFELDPSEEQPAAPEPPKEKIVEPQQIKSPEIKSEYHAPAPPKAPPVKKKKNYFLRISAVLMLLFIAFAVTDYTTDFFEGTGLSVFKGNSDTFSGLLPDEENWDTDTMVNGELGKIVDSMTSEENALTIDNSVKPDTTSAIIVNNISETAGYEEYHIIAGSFKNKEKADSLQQQLTEQGYPAVVLKQGDMLYRVSAIAFKDKESGQRELARFKEKTRNHAAWLLNLKN